METFSSYWTTNAAPCSIPDFGQAMQPLVRYLFTFYWPSQSLISPHGRLIMIEEKTLQKVGPLLRPYCFCMSDDDVRPVIERTAYNFSGIFLIFFFFSSANKAIQWRLSPCRRRPPLFGNQYPFATPICLSPRPVLLFNPSVWGWCLPKCGVQVETSIEVRSSWKAHALLDRSNIWYRDKVQHWYSVFNLMKGNNRGIRSSSFLFSPSQQTGIAWMRIDF